MYEQREGASVCARVYVYIYRHIRFFTDSHAHLYVERERESETQRDREDGSVFPGYGCSVKPEGKLGDVERAAALTEKQI